jgi:predicted GNAT family acetyltransferase
MTKDSHPAVHHNAKAQRFELSTASTAALLEYLRTTDGVVFTHTFVPPELRGKGLAEQLVRAALEWARAEKLRVVPECSYVARFVERNPEYRGLLGTQAN